MQGDITTFSLIIQFGFYSFLAKPPQLAIDALCRDGQAAAVRAPVHRTGPLSVDAGKVGTKRHGTRTAPTGGESTDERPMSLAGTRRLVEIREDQIVLIRINRGGFNNNFL